MCGRLTLRAPAASWCQMFLPQLEPHELPEIPPGPRYNIAPTQRIATIVQHQPGDHRQLMFPRWGLVPSWADDLAIGSRMINARSETVDSKPSFKRAFASRRCLVLADGYYEWAKTASGKQPYLIQPSEGGVVAMAGLWEANKKLAVSDEEPILTCTILTTSANAATESIHDRMPVFLSESDYTTWLDSSFRDTDALKTLLRPAAADFLLATPVSKRVGNVRNDDPECVEPVSIASEQFLFDND
ncbi:MAG: SOS response-associated peptidase [Pirellulaceae bacterium]